MAVGEPYIAATHRFVEICNISIGATHLLCEVSWNAFLLYVYGIFDHIIEERIIGKYLFKTTHKYVGVGVSICERKRVERGGDISIW